MFSCEGNYCAFFVFSSASNGLDLVQHSWNVGTCRFFSAYPRSHSSESLGPTWTPCKMGNCIEEVVEIAPVESTEFLLLAESRNRIQCNLCVRREWDLSSLLLYYLKIKFITVYQVFENVAKKYDIMNDSMSLGIHRIWKDIFLHQMNPCPGTQLLDVAGGTGEFKNNPRLWFLA